MGDIFTLRSRRDRIMKPRQVSIWLLTEQAYLQIIPPPSCLWLPSHSQTSCFPAGRQQFRARPRRTQSRVSRRLLVAAEHRPSSFLPRCKDSHCVHMEISICEFPSLSGCELSRNRQREPDPFALQLSKACDDVRVRFALPGTARLKTWNEFRK